VNVQVIHCPACERRWPIGTDVSDFERQAMEAAACPACGGHVLKCVPVPAKTGRRTRFSVPGGPTFRRAG